MFCLVDLQRRDLPMIVSMINQSFVADEPGDLINASIHNYALYVANGCNRAFQCLQRIVLSYLVYFVVVQYQRHLRDAEGDMQEPGDVLKRVYKPATFVHWKDLERGLSVPISLTRLSLEEVAFQCDSLFDGSYIVPEQATQRADQFGFQGRRIPPQELAQAGGDHRVKNGWGAALGRCD